jgi:hypothetical protein
MTGLPVKNCAVIVAAIAVFGWIAPSAASTPESALKMIKAAGLDASVLKGSESDFAGLEAIVAGAKKEGTLKFRLTFAPKHSSDVECNQIIQLGIYAASCRVLS